MVAPEKYVGYDAEGKKLVTCTATDANTQINPAEVKKGLDNISTTLKQQITIIKNALLALTEEADSALVIDETKTSQLLTATAETIGEIAGCTDQEFESIHQNAISNHDILQENNNTSAHNSAKNHTGVVRVSHN